MVGQTWGQFYKIPIKDMVQEEIKIHEENEDQEEVPEEQEMHKEDISYEETDEEEGPIASRTRSQNNLYLQEQEVKQWM